MILGLILRNWQLIVIGLLLATIAASGVYINLLKAQKDTLVAEKNTLVAELGVSQASVKSLRSAIDDQNLAFEKFKTAADDRAKASAQALSKAKLSANAKKDQATTIFNTKKPEGVSSCDAANDLFNQEIRNAK